METKGGYKKAQKSYSHNTGMDYSPNAGENEMHYVGSSEGARPLGSQSAGVVDGLSTNSDMPVKNYEMVTDNQRPEKHVDSAGDGFQIGVS